jgi:hypothetical protein
MQQGGEVPFETSEISTPSKKAIDSGILPGMLGEILPDLFGELLCSRGEGLGVTNWGLREFDAHDATGIGATSRAELLGTLSDQGLFADARQTLDDGERGGAIESVEHPFTHCATGGTASCIVHHSSLTHRARHRS